MAPATRPPVPQEMLHAIRAIIEPLPETYEEAAWVGTRWRVGPATIVHVFGGEDQLFRIVLRAEPDEVLAFEHLGPPYFRSGWGQNIVGLLIDERTDWTEVSELLTDSYCLQAPQRLASKVDRPGG